MGNVYGRSVAAVPIAEKQLNQVSNDDWVDFLENVLPFDEQIIGALCSRGNQRDYFMQIIKRNSLEGVELENKNSNKLYQNILNGYSEQIKRYWMQM